MSAHADDAVLIGGWVSDVRFPDARPAHVGSIDVDFALRPERAAHAAVVALLLRNGFRPGAHSYQFLKDIVLGHGLIFSDLLVLDEVGYLPLDKVGGDLFFSGREPAQLV